MSDVSGNKRCTWSSCKQRAAWPQYHADGHIWAELCYTHDKQLAEELKTATLLSITNLWAKASGEAKEFTDLQQTMHQLPLPDPEAKANDDSQRPAAQAYTLRSFGSR